ncbi:MAG: hypothetical protein OXS29_17190 [bacterium]|nr:hypothetical protein [bacterium]MDE0287160.1 hypothetical protein [bacterium]MDE0437503.1 hypothetical protein [bacterium]
MPDSWDTSQSGIGGIVDRMGSIFEPLSAYVPLEVVLVVAVGASAMVVWWLARKLVKLALYAAIVGGAAWVWYFGVPI